MNDYIAIWTHSEDVCDAFANMVIFNSIKSNHSLAYFIVNKRELRVLRFLLVCETSAFKLVLYTFSQVQKNNLKSKI